MPHKVLHVLSSDFYAGSVAYALKLSEKQQEEGHEVHVITDNAHFFENVPVVKWPVSKRSMKQRMINIFFIVKFIRKNKITIIHAHSRAASWISFFAAKICKVPLVSTIHGRQVTKGDIYGEKIIGICPNLVEHLQKEMGYDPKKLTFIPNEINTSLLQKFKRTRTTPEIIISVIGRFNGPKGENFGKLVSSVFPTLLEQYTNLQINLIGGEWQSFPEKAKNDYESLRNNYQN